MIKLKTKQKTIHILRDSASYLDAVAKGKIYIALRLIHFFTNLAIAPKERRNVSNEIAMCYNGTLWRTYDINE